MWNALTDRPLFDTHIFTSVSHHCKRHRRGRVSSSSQFGGSLHYGEQTMGGGGEQANKGTRGRGRLSWLPRGAVVARLAPGSRPCLPCGRELGWEPPLVSTDTWHIPAHGRAYKSITLTHIKQYHYTTMSTVPQCFCSNRIWNVPRGSSVEGVALRVSQGSGGDSGSRFWGGVPEENTGHPALTLCPQIPYKQTCFTKCSLLRCSASPHAQSDGIR